MGTALIKPVEIDFVRFWWIEANNHTPGMWFCCRVKRKCCLKKEQISQTICCFIYIWGKL